MMLDEMIYKRRSVRSYVGVPAAPLLITKISEFIKTARPLYPEIKTRAEIITGKDIKSVFPWTPPQAVAFFSEDRDGAYENAGFVLQQTELYIQSLGLGACWLGMGRASESVCSRIFDMENLKYITMLVFGYPKGEQFRKDVSYFKRKPLSEISDTADQRLTPARLAPSSINSQPWFFKQDGTVFHVYCKNGISSFSPANMNRINIGISLAHMYVSNPETFAFFKTENAIKQNSSVYVGSFKI